MDPGRYEQLKLEQRDNGVLVVTFDNPSKLNAITERGHFELVSLWPDVDADPTVRVVLLRGEGGAFSAGGDYAMIEKLVADVESHRRVLKETRDLVRNIIEFSKPIVSAINGVAVGAGLAAALMADIPVAARSARILDGHTAIGVTAGDHAAVIWPLLIGMAKSKYHLMLNHPIDGAEAERLGLVARVVDDSDLAAVTEALADELAVGAQEAIRWTKHTLNHWLRMAYPIFDASVAYEFLGFQGSDVVEGIAASKEKRKPGFD
jgi:enoyl-CoA hydratase